MRALQPLTYVLSVAELLALACGLATWKKWRYSPWKWFTLYLLFICLGEAFGRLTMMYGHHELNRFYYNVLAAPAEFLCAFLMFYLSGSSRRNRVLPVTCAGIYLVAIVIDKCHHTGTWFTTSYIVGDALLLILILRYFLQLVAGDALLHFRRDMLFWVAAGWLIFYLGTMPFYGMQNVLRKNYRDVFIAYNYLQYTLNIIMYLLFSVGFLCGKPK